MDSFRQIIDKLSLFLCRLASVALLIIVALVAINIVGRKVFNFPITGIIEIVQYGMLLVMVLAMAKTTISGGHVSVSIITQKLPKAIRAIIEFVGLMFSCGIVAIAAWTCIKYVPKMYSSGLVTESYKIPFYIIYVVMSAGLISAALAFLFNAVSSVASLAAKSQEGDAEN